MKVLVLGADSRAHALVWKLFNSPAVTELVCAPGNGGTGVIVPAVDLDLSDAVAVARWAFEEGFDIIVPADSLPLQHGLVDEVVSFHIGVCGPSFRSALLERSRCQAKEFMLRHHLPTAPGRAFTNLATAEKYLATLPLPVVIKADDPAAGEAVYRDRHAALTGLHELFAARSPDVATGGVVIEAHLQGPRVVLSAFTDGRTAVPLLATRLYDHLEASDGGPLAAGMGAHTGISRFAKLLTAHLHEKFIVPIVAGMAQEGLPYWGILGVDCIITADGPRLTSIRCSFRRSEAEVVLPRLEDDLLPWIQAMIAQRLHELPSPRWAATASVGIGLIVNGYPRHFPTGGLIEGIDDLEAGVLAFHNATENPAALRYIAQAQRARANLISLFGSPVSSPALHVAGGHVLTLVAMGATLAGARGRALVNAERVRFVGRAYRPDIGAKEFG